MSEIHPLQNGVYRAAFAGARAMPTRGGDKIKVTFKWTLNGLTPPRTMFSCSVLGPVGGPWNPKAVAYINRWLPEWPGQDPDWIEVHVADFQGREVKLTIQNEPNWQNPSEIVPVVKWVNPLGWSKPEAFDLAAFDRASVDWSLVEPTITDVWAAFASLAEKAKLSQVRRDATWVKLVHSLVPEKDQLDFTTADWQLVLNHLKGTK